jgi:hypothetical protein
MIGQKMLVAPVIIRLRTRREELTSVLQHLRAAVAPRELTPIKAADTAEAAVSCELTPIEAADTAEAAVSWANASIAVSVAAGSTL